MRVCKNKSVHANLIIIILPNCTNTLFFVSALQADEFIMFIYWNRFSLFNKYDGILNSKIIAIANYNAENNIEN